MKLFEVHKDVMCGQCKGALLRVQIRYTAVFIFPGLIRGWAGSRVGIFTPRKTDHGYKCTGFYFQPWLAPDKAIGQLPTWYRRLMQMISFRWD